MKGQTPSRNVKGPLNNNMSKTKKKLKDASKGSKNVAKNFIDPLDHGGKNVTLRVPSNSRNSSAGAGRNKRQLSQRSPITKRLTL